MYSAISLRKDLVDQVKAIAAVQHRSVAKQIEHWIVASIEEEDWFCPVCKNEPGYFKPNAETIKAMQDCDAGIGMTTVGSVEELMSQLNADD